MQKTGAEDTNEGNGITEGSISSKSCLAMIF
jgi:hypothetical protein